MRILFICDAFATKTGVELFFLRELSFAKPLKRVHVLVRVDAFLQQQLPLVFFWHQFVHDGELIDPLYQLLKGCSAENFTLSTNLRFPSENEMYFSVFVGMHLFLPAPLPSLASAGDHP